MESFFSVQMVLAIGGALFLFCLGVALVAVAIGRVEMDKRKADTLEQERRHKERLRALELGFPLPEAELARAEAEGKRANSASLVGFMVPLGLGGIAVGATSMILHQDNASLTPVLYAIWGVVGLVSTMTVIMSLLALRRGSPSTPSVRREPVRIKDDQLVSSAP